MNTRNQQSSRRIIDWLIELSNRVGGTELTTSSWSPPSEEIHNAEHLINYLENKRVLYDLLQNEVLGHVIDSILIIRGHLEVELTKVSRSSELANSIRQMQSACRVFLTKIQATKNWETKAKALLELRDTFFVSIGRIVAAYNIEINEDTINILTQLEAHSAQEQSKLRNLLQEPIKHAAIENQ